MKISTPKLTLAIASLLCWVGAWPVHAQLASAPTTKQLSEADTATGSTVPSTVAQAYKQLIEYANQHPNEHITICTTGFAERVSWTNGQDVLLAYDAKASDYVVQGSVTYTLKPDRFDLVSNNAVGQIAALLKRPGEFLVDGTTISSKALAHRVRRTQH